MSRSDWGGYLDILVYVIYNSGVGVECKIACLNAMERSVAGMKETEKEKSSCPEFTA